MFAEHAKPRLEGGTILVLRMFKVSDSFCSVSFILSAAEKQCYIVTQIGQAKMELDSRIGQIYNKTLLLL